MSKPGLSVIIPIKDEEENIAQLQEELDFSLRELQVDWECIWIDDGSSDNSWGKITKLSNAHHRGVRLQKNYGQSIAIIAGVKVSRFSLIATLDGDLQNDPRDIPLLLSKISDEIDVVQGFRELRQDPLLTKKIPSKIANKFIKTIFRSKQNDLGCSMRVFRRDLIESNWTTGDMHRFLGLYFELIGARVIQIPVRHRARKFGKSKYSLRRFLQLPGDLILLKGQQVVLRRPVHFFFALAFPLWVISLALIFFAFFLRLSGARPYLDTTLILGGLLLFVTGLIILSLGFFSEIIIRLLFSNNQRTHFIVKELI